MASVESYRLVSQAAGTEASAAFGGAFRLRCLASLHCERILSIGRAKAEQKVHRVPLEDMGLCNSDPLGWSVGRRHKTRTCPQLCMMCVNRCELW